MEFRILGPIEVIDQGRVVPVGGGRERVILARLLVATNQVVSAERLAEDLWCDNPPEGAAQALWAHISRLRKALREHGGDEILVTRSPGYVLQVEPEDVDAARFEALLARARQSAASADPGAAAATLREALNLWRGPALANVADAPFARAEAARLEEVRLAALEERVEADLACGRHGELAGELSGLTRDHPLRERLWGQRMLALYRAGRQAEALRVYQDLRRVLGGIEPGETLRRLETAILRHEPELDWRPPGSPAVDGLVSATSEESAPASGVVSFLFTDLVGSTELLSRLGDEAADELRRRHFGQLRRALADHGGTEVKSLGDGLMAAFGSPVAALRCAVAIQRVTEADRSHPGPRLAVRVGLHAGEPLSDGDDYFGTPVVVAQRLCDRARGGQILASALIQGLAGNRADCAFREIGGLALMGLAEPVAACEVAWEERSEVAVPFPLPLEREESRSFVGREDELARLEAAWEAARSGRRRLVLLAGEPGIGKTRLAARIARLAHASGAVVLFGHYDEGMGVPYQPVVEALGTYVRQARGPVLGRLAGELVRLVPEIAAHSDDLPSPLHSDPETERYRLFDAVAAWLAGVSAETPVVFVVDDLQWASRPTLALLLHLVRSGEPLRLLVVASYRDTDLDVGADLADAVADLLRQPGVDRLRLRGLDEADVAALMEAHARLELDDATRSVVATLHAETGGNPLFLSQVLRHLMETHAMVRRDGRWIPEDRLSEAGIPDDVRDVIDRRLARLPAETRDTLACAAVVGDRFDLAVLVRAGGEAEISTLRALDPAIAARLAQDLGDPERLTRAAFANHRGIFSMMDEVDAERVSVIEAALEALGTTDSAVRARLLVNLGSELCFAPDHERRHRLVAEAVAMARRLEDPITLGYVFVTGHFSIRDRLTPVQLDEHRIELAAARRDLRDPALQFWAAYAGLRAALTAGDFPAANELLEAMARSAETVGQPIMRWMALLLKAVQSRIAGRLEQADALNHEAFETATGEPDAFRYFGGQLFWIRYDQGRMEELLERFTRAAARPGARALTRALLCVALCELDRPDEARPIFNDLAVGDFAAVGYPRLGSLAALALACAGLDDTDRAAVLYGHLTSFDPLLPSPGMAFLEPVAHYLGLLATTLGRYDEAGAHFEEAARMEAGMETPCFLARTRWEWARMLSLGAGPEDKERALALAGQALATAEELGMARVACRTREFLEG